MAPVARQIDGHFMCTHCDQWVPKEMDSQQVCGSCGAFLAGVEKAQDQMKRLVYALNETGQMKSPIDIRVSFLSGGQFQCVGVIEGKTG